MSTPPVPEPGRPDPSAPPAPSEETGAPDARDLGEIPAVEIITRAAVMLLSGAADKLGLGADDGATARLDLDEARRLIDALAGLLKAAEPTLGLHRQPLRDGLRSVQAAFREASPYPDAPGTGPGERAS